MDRLIYTAMSGASQILVRQAAVANNLANVSTAGYRSEEHRLRAVQVNAQGNSTALPTRAFEVDASTHADFSQGPATYTGRPLDVTVQGSGWIAVAKPDGSEAYTRSGDLEISVNGVLQTRGGLPVQSDGGTITAPPDNWLTIAADGTVSAVPDTGIQTMTTLGRIKLVNPPEADLVRGEDGLFHLRDGTAAPLDENVKLASNYLEGSNVNPVEQMVSMISLGRQFEMQMKMLTNASDNDKAATQVITQL